LPANDAAASDLGGSLANNTNIYSIGLQFAEINIPGNGASGTAYSTVKEQTGKCSTITKFMLFGPV